MTTTSDLLLSDEEMQAIADNVGFNISDGLITKEFQRRIRRAIAQTQLEVVNQELAEKDAEIARLQALTFHTEDVLVIVETERAKYAELVAAFKDREAIRLFEELFNPDEERETSAAQDLEDYWAIIDRIVALAALEDPATDYAAHKRRGT